MNKDILDLIVSFYFAQFNYNFGTPILVEVCPEVINHNTCEIRVLDECVKSYIYLQGRGLGLAGL